MKIYITLALGLDKIRLNVRAQPEILKHWFSRHYSDVTLRTSQLS